MDNCLRNLETHYIYIFLVLMYISYSNCIIEIPLEPIEVNGIPKYNYLSTKDSIMFKNKTKLDIRNLNEEGNAFIANNLLFVGKVKIGSNRQEFNLVLDTGSYITWVAAQGSQDSVSIARHFNPSASNTCQKTKVAFQQAYGTGQVSGIYHYDNFYYINDREFKLGFGLATKTYFPIGVADGIIGLGHSYYNMNDISFIHMLQQAGITNSKSFSLKFGNNINPGASGKLILGKHDDFSNGNLPSCPLRNINDQNQIYWACQLNGVGLKTSQNEIRSQKTYYVIFDTGTNAITLPMDYFNELEGNLPKINCMSVTNEKQDSFYVVCPSGKELPNFIFEFNGNRLILPSYNIFYRQGQFYYSRVIFTKSSQLFIIGSPFFFIYHTLFDKESERLVFYPEQNTNVQLISENYIDNNNSLSYTHIIIIISSVLLFIGLISIIYYSIRKIRTIKRMESIESSLLSN